MVVPGSAVSVERGTPVIGQKLLQDHAPTLGVIVLQHIDASESRIALTQLSGSAGMMACPCGVSQSLFEKSMIKNSCSQLHYPKGFNLNSFSYESAPCLKCKARRILEPRAVPNGTALQEQLLRSNVKQFQGGLVFKARRLLYHSSLGRE